MVSLVITSMLSCTPLKTIKVIVLTVGLFSLMIFMNSMSPWQYNSTNKKSQILRLTQYFKSDTVEKKECRFHTCFEINNCQFSLSDKIGIYVYPNYVYMYANDTHPQDIVTSREYNDILETIISSEYYQPLPYKACVFVPSVDTLNQQRMNVSLISNILHGLPWWNKGYNHLIFSMLSGEYSSYNTTPDFIYEHAMLAGSALDIINYRTGFDISIPIYNSLTIGEYKLDYYSSRKTLLTVLLQLGTDPLLVHAIDDIHKITNDRIIILGSCEHCQPCQTNSRCSLEEGIIRWSYPKVLLESEFCLILPGYRVDSPDFLDVMMTGCIPVLLRNTHQVLPFSEVLDWDRCVIFVWEEELQNILKILGGISERVRREKREQIHYFYNRYFYSMKTITMATLHILNGYIFPTSAPGYEWWNNPSFNSEMTEYFQHSYPLSLELPAGQPKQGFTAVILTHDRVSMLFETIRSIANAPSLHKILVVWNNVDKDPPLDNEWPIINKPIKVIRSKRNELGNRFYPYPEIETTAVLSLDDDITMMSHDEIEFGFKAWLESPKQIVGYPGRVHLYDTHTNSWKYISEWMNNISVVLTGAAFYHKYYHYLYTYTLPHAVREWVNYNFNCEDIVFNFMVAHYTGLPPIKIKKVIEIWYPGRALIGLPGYRISLAFGVK